MVRGKFIVFEGLDGSGQSTQVELTKKFLEENQIKVLATKEPTNTLIGGAIKTILKKEWKVEQDTLQLLFAADRAHHLWSDIIPALEQETWVISDRYMFSSLAFGTVGNKEQVSYNWLKMINSNFLKPDAVFYLDTSAESCIKRVSKSRVGHELFEETEKLKEVRKNFMKIKDDFSNFYIIDGEQSIEEVQKSVRKIIQGEFDIKT